MMNCIYCKAGIVAPGEKCPLCQSKLTGEPEKLLFPAPEKLRKRSLFFKLQLFVAVVIIIAGVTLDFMIGVRLGSFTELHWSLLLAMWVTVLELEILRHIAGSTGFSRSVTMFAFAVCIMLLVTGYCFGILWLMLDWIVPTMLAVVMAVNFVFALLDKHGNSMAYLLSSLFVGILPFIVLCFRRGSAPAGWIACLVTSLIILAATLIFRGREALREIRRRLRV